MRSSLIHEIETTDLLPTNPVKQYGLTERELEIIQLVSHGLSNDEIAHVCFISTGTVKVHFNHIYSKTGCSSRNELVRMILQHS